LRERRETSFAAHSVVAAERGMRPPPTTVILALDARTQLAAALAMRM
jgi:hypothetical protein